MAPSKRKADKDTEEGEPKAKASKTAAATGKTADKLGLSYDDFAAGAPDLHATISSKPKDSKNSKEGEITLVSFDLPKLKMSSGSYGWSGSNKRINVEVEVDGEIKKVQAQVTLNITVMGSKKVEDGKGKQDEEEEEE